MIKITQKGDFKKLNRFLKKSIKITKVKNIELFAQKCVERLKEVTPKDTGLTASSWEYVITRKRGFTNLQINNTNIQNGENIALILEYGHGSKNGTWIEGKNFVEPALIKTYRDLLDTTWKEMERL